MAKNLILGNKVILSPIQPIIKQIKAEYSGLILRQMVVQHGELVVTCPSRLHKNGNESSPSCHIFDKTLSPDQNLVHGTFHCFSCGLSGSLQKFVSTCFQCSMDDAEEWLCDRFGEEIEGLEDVIDPELFDIGNKERKKQNKELDPSILEAYNQFHPYMKTRKLTDEVIKKFQIGYNPTLNTITFPVYDERHRLVMITQRGIATKKFYIDTGAEKPVYLLYDLIENNKDTAFITESQINALTLRGYGYDAVALFGTGSDEQYDILMKSGIKKFILCFDGDYAGRSGARKFKRRFSDGKHLIIDIVMPDGKDVNDITKEEFDELFEKSLEKI